jgi:murein DD-endopeptidase MepM/ murein hydrolase activator NlpD
MAQKPAHRPARPGLLERWRHRYRILVMHDDHYEAKYTFRLSVWNIVVLLSFVVLVMVGLTIYLAAFTGLREYIPGYADVEQRRLVRSLSKTVDSLEVAMLDQARLLTVFQQVASGKKWEEPMPVKPDSALRVVEPVNRISRAEAQLREMVEEEERFTVQPKLSRNNALEGMLFFPPLRGKVITPFQRENKEFGVDVMASEEATVLSCLEGTVVFAGWTAESGYVMAIQHPGNLVSIYQNNATLLKKLGSFVRAGEPIGIAGKSLEPGKGPFLHFELWFNGTPMDPESMIQF